MATWTVNYQIWDFNMTVEEMDKLKAYIEATAKLAAETAVGGRDTLYESIEKAEAEKEMNLVFFRRPYV